MQIQKTNEKTIGLFGASGGVGKPLMDHLLSRGHHVHAFCRSDLEFENHIQIDLSDPRQVEGLPGLVGDTVFDAIIFAAGTWENAAFTDGYRFSETTVQENRNVLEVNLVAPILITHALLNSLNQEEGAKLIFFGAVSGLDHFGSPEVANTATKFGLIGMVQALHKTLKGKGVSCTVINPEYLETAEVLQDMADGTIKDQIAIPLDDIHRTVDFVLDTSNRCAITEINIEQVH